MYAHEEAITELGISKSDLPKELQARLKAFTNRARFAKKQEMIEKLEDESDDLANHIIEWFNDEDEEDEEEEEDEEDEQIVRKTEENQPNIVSHVKNEEIGTEEEESSWGLNTGNW